MQALCQRICAALRLGDLAAAPIRLSGGYTHRMVALTTTTGRYAVKLLNPEIMARPGVLENYARAERHETRLATAGLPILPAKIIDGSKMHCVNGQHLYVFDYYDGRVLPDDEITPAHCAAMGNVLARIHAVSQREAATEADVRPIAWPLLTAGLLRHRDTRKEGAALHRALPQLIRVTHAMQLAAARLPRMEALCHNDMDAKNVLFARDDFRIIDLECIDYANPGQELLDLAISWAGWPADEGKFTAFLRAYHAAGGRIAADPADLFDSRRNHLDWLAYNARRALSDDPEERRTGREQILETLGKIASDQQNRSMILRWMDAAMAD